MNEVNYEVRNNGLVLVNYYGNTISFFPKDANEIIGAIREACKQADKEIGARIKELKGKMCEKP